MRRLAILCILILVFWGCLTVSKSYRLGTQEAMNKKWDKAVEHYERAVLEYPKDPTYRLALVRAKIYASNMHLYRARTLATQGKKDEAIVEYEKALSFDPSNRVIFNEARRFAEKKPAEKEPEELKFDPPVKLRVSKDKIVLKFTREISLRSIFQALGKYSGINIIFDENFRDKPFAIDLTDMTFEQAINTVCMATRNFYRIVDEKSILVVPDQIQNRMKYELNAIKTFYLSNILAQDVQQWLVQMVRSAQKVPVITHNKELNSITIKDTPEKLALAEKIIKLWDKPKGEVVIDMEIMMVSRQRIRDLGLDLDSHSIGVRYSGEQEADTGWRDIDSLDFSKSENFQITLPTGLLKFLETDADTKMIAQPRLRGVHGEKIEYMVGDEVPIPQTTFSPIAAGGVSSQPITSFQYKNVGIEVIITPMIHLENEVSLELDLKIKALGDSGFGGLPIITTRQIKNIIRLKDGETNLLAGLLKDEERKTMKGILGIKSLPLLGNLFSSTDQTIQQTDVILTITPYIIRNIPLEAEDFAPLWIPLEGISMGRGVGPTPTGEQDYLSRKPGTTASQAEQEDEGANRIFLNPPGFETAINRNFQITVNLRSQAEIQNMSLTINFNPQVLQLKSITRGNVIQQLGEPPSFLENIDNDGGNCVIGFSSPQVSSGYKGMGRVATLQFQPIKSGESLVSVSNYTANSTSGLAINFDTNETRVTVR